MREIIEEHIKPGKLITKRYSDKPLDSSSLIFSNEYSEAVQPILFWPVADSFSDVFPAAGEPGSFWEDRQDRFHCGVDVYAHFGASVVAIESGRIIDTGVFTSPEKNDYWNTTFYIIIKTSGNVNYKYAELSEALVNIGDFVAPGQEIGKVGMVINKDRINYHVPEYIRELISRMNYSMLHIELYKAPMIEVRPYSGGNFFGAKKPDSLLNPLYYLPDLKK